MKLDEIPATTKEYWGKKMKTKKKSAPIMTEQMDPMVTEQLSAMRGNPNLRPMGQKRMMRRADGGTVKKDEKYLVGEKGPEKFVSKEDYEANADKYKAADMAPPEMSMKHEWGTKTEVVPKISVIRGMNKTKELPDERRKGGPVKKAKPYLVGEEGPEMFTPKQDGVIIPNDNLRPMGQKKTMRGEKGKGGIRVCKTG
jgi:SLT domain-containing protein